MANYILSNELHEIVQYPYTLRQLQLDNPNTGFPKNLKNKPDTLSEFYVFAVTPTAKPSTGPDQVMEEDTPERVNGVWNQRWTTRPATEQEQAAAENSIRTNFSNLIQKRLDEFAQTRNYSSILSAVTYENDANPVFAQEAVDAKRLRSETWSAAYQLLAEVEAGTRPIPNSISDIENDLPVLAWSN